LNRSFRRETPLYHGWVIAFTLAITETVSWGIIYYAFSVFITPMEKDLGWSRSELTGGFSLALLVMGIMAFPVGSWIDQHGARLLMTIGSILASLLVIAWSRVSDLTHFYLIWAGLGVCAACVLYEPAFAVIAKWFTRRRSRALAVITFAAGLASTIFLPLSDLLLRAFGWRDAVLVLGLLLAVLTILPHAIILRRHPSDLGLLPDGARQTSDTPVKLPSVSLSSALGSRSFWMLTLAFACTGLAASAVRVHFVPLLIDAGFDPSAAALASGSIGLMQVAGRLVFAPLEERFSAHLILAGVFAMQAAAMAVLLFGPTLLVVCIFLVVFGTSIGALTLTRASIIAERFGAASYGRISSVMSVFVSFAGTAAPIGAGLLYDHFGNYQPVLILALLFALVAVIIAALTRSVDQPVLNASDSLIPEPTVVGAAPPSSG
jgi:MFS family permease